MRKYLLLLLISVITVSSVFAGDFVFSGEFKAGYRFLIGSDDSALKFPSGKGKELKLNLDIKNDFCTVSIKNITNSNPGPSLNVEMNIDKLVSMGNLKLAVNLGTGKNTAILSSFNDVSADGFGKMMFNGSYAGQLKFSFHGIDLNTYYSPFKGDYSGRQSKYSQYGVSVRGAFARDCISASVSYLNSAKIKLVSVNDKNDESTVNPSVNVSDLFSMNAVSLSAKINISELAGLKSKLIFSFYDHISPDGVFYFSNRKSLAAGIIQCTLMNSFAMNLYAETGKISAWAEYRQDSWFNVKTAAVSQDAAVYEKSGNIIIPGFLLNTKYSFTPLLSLGITGGIENCITPESSWKVTGLICFSALNVEFGYKASEHYFHIKPLIKVKF